MSFNASIPPDKSTKGVFVGYFAPATLNYVLFLRHAKLLFMFTSDVLPLRRAENVLLHSLPSTSPSKSSRMPSPPEVFPNTLKSMLYTLYTAGYRFTVSFWPLEREFPLKSGNYLLISKHLVFFLCSGFLEDFGFEFIFQNMAKACIIQFFYFLPSTYPLRLEMFFSFF